MRKRRTRETPQPILEWIRNCLEEGKSRGLTQSDLGRALGLSPQQGHKLVLGERRILAADLPLISAYFGKPIPNIGSSIITVPVKGIANTNHWHEEEGNATVNGMAHQMIPAIADRYPGLPQYAYRIHGSLINRKIADGAFAICVPYDQARKEPHDGDFALFEIRRSNLHKTMVLRLRRIGSNWELQPYSIAERDAKKMILKLMPDMHHVVGSPTDYVTIKGLVIGTYGTI